MFRGGITPTGLQSITMSPTLVPPSFFGLCSQDWPWNGTVAGTAPTFTVGRLSNYDNSRTHWRTIHTANNTINWTAIDNWVVNAKAAGIVKGTYVLYGCPTFLASTGAAVAGPYGGLGEGAYPGNNDATLTQLQYFCTQFATRNIGTWGKFFDTISIWNEPTFTTTPNGSNFFWGTRPQFVDMHYAAYSALKAADSTLNILSPGMFYIRNATSGFDQWINQSGTIYPTKTGKDCFDGIANHPYHSYPNHTYGGFGDLSSCSLGGMNSINGVLLQYGKSISGMYITEYGISSGVDTELAQFLALSAADRKKFISRLLMSAAMYGYKSFCAFSFGNVSNLIGNLSTDTTGVIAGWQDAYSNMVNKTIVSGGWLLNGSMTVTFSDNSTYTV